MENVRNLSEENKIFSKGVIIWLLVFVNVIIFILIVNKLDPEIWDKVDNFKIDYVNKALLKLKSVLN